MPRGEDVCSGSGDGDVAMKLQIVSGVTPEAVKVLRVISGDSIFRIAAVVIMPPDDVGWPALTGADMTMKVESVTCITPETAILLREISSDAIAVNPNVLIRLLVKLGSLYPVVVTRR